MRDAPVPPSPSPVAATAASAHAGLDHPQPAGDGRVAPPDAKPDADPDGDAPLAGTGHAASAAATGATACPNCHAPLTLPAPHHCPHCGQETRVRPPTVGEFARQFADQYLATDGALWRTLGTLLARPGALTLAYLAGRRRHYVLPLRLYLSISVIVLLGINALLDARLSRLPELRIDVATSSLVAIDLGAVRVAVDRGRFQCRGLPVALCQRLSARLMADPADLWQRATQAGQRATGKLGAALFVLMPVFALLLLAAFAGQRWRYAEHLVFALHVHAWWLLAVGVAVLAVPGLTQAAWAAIPVYGAWAAWRVYGGPAWALALRLLAVTVAYIALLIVVLGALVLWALMQ
jgi:hypothetical protein